MADCEDYANWDDLDESERMDALREAINDYLKDAGYDPASVFPADAPGSGVTDMHTGDITLDKTHVRTDGRKDVYDTAYHETWHAMDVQDGVMDRLSADQVAAFNDHDTELYIDQDDVRTDFDYEVSEHDNAYDFGRYMADAMEEECGGPPPPQKPPPSPESGAETLDFGPFNWDEVPTPDDSANEADEPGFEIDEDNVVVTDADSASELDDLEGPGYEEDFEEIADDLEEIADDLELTAEDAQKKITDMNLEIDIEEGAVSPDNSGNESDEAEAAVAGQYFLGN